MKKITTIKEKLYRDAINKWGADLQIGMFHEELAELIKAVNKYRRKCSADNYQDVIEEMADVRVMIEQVMVYFGIMDKDVQRAYEVKLVRLQNMLNKKK